MIKVGEIRVRALYCEIKSGQLRRLEFPRVFLQPRYKS